MPGCRDDSADVLRKRILQVTNDDNKKNAVTDELKYFIIRATQAQGNQGNQIMHNKLVNAEKNVSKKHPVYNSISRKRVCYFPGFSFPQIEKSHALRKTPMKGAS